MTAKLLLLVSLVYMNQAASAQTACVPSDSSCEFYSCLENQVQCGPQGYLDRFATPLCERYRADEAVTFSGKLYAWYPKVRLCLQQALVNLEDVSSCDDLQAKALASHADCYFQTGFCDLDWSDRIQIGRLAGRSIFQQAVWEAGLKVLAQCQRARHSRP